MDILHIIPINGSHIIPLAETLQRCDKENTHTFLVTTVFQTVLSKDIELLRIRNLQYMPVFKKQASLHKALYFIKCAKKADHIVWHSFRVNGGYTPFFLFFCRKFLKKSTWIPAEGEIGNFMSVSNRFLNRFSGFVNRYVQRNVSCIGISVPCEQKVLEEFGIKKPAVKVLPYVQNSVQKELLTHSLEKKRSLTKNPSTFVQIGLSSQLGNNHRELLDRLCELSDYSDACVFLPFRYAPAGVPYASGTKMYMNKVRAKARKLECKTFFMERKVNIEDYLRLLSRMDIVILGNHEVFQMNMVVSLLAMGKRIFMPQESPLYQYLCELGAGVHSLEQLSEAGSLSCAMELPETNLPQELQSYFEAEQTLSLWKQWSGSIRN